MELVENKKMLKQIRYQFFPGLNLSADYNLTQGGMEGYFIERKCLSGSEQTNRKLFW